MPSASLGTTCASTPASRSAAAVPEVAKMPNPWRPSVLATGRMRGLSASLTLMKTLPSSGSGWPASICDLAKASANVRPTPITSPVDFISGPSRGSTPGNRLNGITDSFTE